MREDTEGIVGVPVPDAATVVVESPLAGMWDLEVRCDLLELVVDDACFAN